MKYFLIKITREYEEERDRSVWFSKPSFLEFAGTADTLEEAEKWAEKTYVPNFTTPFAIKGEEVYFNIDRKVTVETKARATEKDEETIDRLKELHFFSKK